MSYCEQITKPVTYRATFNLLDALLNRLGVDANVGRGIDREIDTLVLDARLRLQGNNIDLDVHIPGEDFEPVRVSLAAGLSPGTLDAEIDAELTFDQVTETLHVQPRFGREDKAGTAAVGRFATTAGAEFDANLVFNLGVPFLPTKIDNHRVNLLQFLKLARCQHPKNQKAVGCRRILRLTPA